MPNPNPAPQTRLEEIYAGLMAKNGHLIRPNNGLDELDFRVIAIWQYLNEQAVTREREATEESSGL